MARSCSFCSFVFAVLAGVLFAPMHASRIGFSCTNHHGKCTDCVNENRKYCVYSTASVDRQGKILAKGECHSIKGNTYRKFPGNLEQTQVWAYNSLDCDQFTNAELATTRGRAFLDMPEKFTEFYHFGIVALEAFLLMNVLI